MLHVVEEVEAHDVEAEAVDLVLARIEHEGVDHQLLHHAMFAGGIGATGAGLQIAVGIEAVVVAGHDFIQVRVRAFAGGAGVIEDDVLDHAQTRVVQPLHHGAVFARRGCRD